MRPDRRLIALTSLGLLAPGRLLAQGSRRRSRRSGSCDAPPPGRPPSPTRSSFAAPSPLFPTGTRRSRRRSSDGSCRSSVREGDAVTVGQPIARIDSAALVDEARAAEAAVARTRAELKNAVATSARVQRVFEHGIAARQEVDDATARADSATAAQNEAESAARRAQRQVERAHRAKPPQGRGRADLPAARRAGRRHAGDPDRRGRRSRVASSSTPTPPRAIWCSCGRVSRPT